ncbi:MAG TPA: hypothetical protein EYG40_10955 [Verrucomicrobia bacterium]|nr:hypothetical protein [Verrucomicrobiales bacterium]HIL55539.1 hypothetical protein [Verrucomicrobiota bacterium]
MKRSLFIGILSFTLPYLIANELKQEAAPLGIKIQIKDYVIPGPEVEPKPLNKESAIVLRITSVYPHGNSFRYDFEYYGLEAGSFDLGDYLQGKDKKPMTDPPTLPVTFKSSLAPERMKPNPPDDGKLPRFIKYKHLLIFGAAFWLIGFLLLIFGARKKLNLMESSSPELLSPAEILRPLVEAARKGKLGKEGQARLERTLIIFWRQRMNLTNESPSTALSKIKAHPEAAPLFEKLESWFHCPNPEEPSDLDALLKPYREPKID